MFHIGALIGSRRVRREDRSAGLTKCMVLAADPTPIEDDQLHSLKKRLTRSYTKQSATYDARRSMSVSARFFFDVAYQALDEMIGNTNEEILHIDVPVGTARFLWYLRDHGRKHRMFGFDLAPGMLRVCKRKALERSENLAVAQGDAFHLPLADNSVDIVTSMRFFHLIPRNYWPMALEEMYRVLRPGGFLIAELRNPCRGLAVAWIADTRDRWFRNGGPHAYVWPRELRHLFRDWERIETRGTGLDGLGWLSTVAPAFARRLHGLSRYSPWRYLTRDLVVKAYKPIC